VLKGDAVAGPLLTSDTVPFLGCIPPATIPRPSEQFPPGTQVMVYLDQGPDSFRLAHIEPPRKDPAHVRAWVAFRGKLDGPREEVAALLAPGKKLGVGFDWALIHAGRVDDVLPEIWGLLLEDAGTTGQVIHHNALMGLIQYVEPAKLRERVGEQAVTTCLEELQSKNADAWLIERFSSSPEGQKP
jgi:hypothetical protein